MRIIKVAIGVLCLLSLFSFQNHANANYTSEEFQESYYVLGYKSVQKAIEDGEDHFKREIALPAQLPPVAFTHIFGRFTNFDGEENDDLEIEMINKDMPQNHCMIWIKPIGHKLVLKKEYIDKVVLLKDSSKGIYSTKAARGFNMFSFEKDGWQYILNVHKGISDIITVETLTDIANSIE